MTNNSGFPLKGSAGMTVGRGFAGMTLKECNEVLGTGH